MAEATLLRSQLARLRTQVASLKDAVQTFGRAADASIREGNAFADVSRLSLEAAESVGGPVARGVARAAL